MDDEKIVKLVNDYFCVFRGNPIHCAPYAMFATIQQANIHVRKLGLSGPITFEKWRKEFQIPIPETKLSWEP